MNPHFSIHCVFGKQPVTRETYSDHKLRHYCLTIVPQKPGALCEQYKLFVYSNPTFS